MTHRYAVGKVQAPQQRLCSASDRIIHEQLPIATMFDDLQQATSLLRPIRIVPQAAVFLLVWTILPL